MRAVAGHPAASRLLGRQPAARRLLGPVQLQHERPRPERRRSAARGGRCRHCPVLAARPGPPRRDGHRPDRRRVLLHPELALHPGRTAPRRDGGQSLRTRLVACRGWGRGGTWPEACHQLQASALGLPAKMPKRPPPDRPLACPRPQAPLNLPPTRSSPPGSLAMKRTMRPTSRRRVGSIRRRPPSCATCAEPALIPTPERVDMEHQVSGTEQAGHVAGQDHGDATGEEPRSALRYTRIRKIFAFAFWFLFALAGLTGEDPADWHASGPELWLRLLTPLVIYAWFVYDAKCRDFRPGMWLRIGVFLIAPIGIPVYLVKSRGWRGSLKSAARFIGILVALAVGLLAIDFLFLEVLGVELLGE